MIHNKVYNIITSTLALKTDIPTELKDALLKSDIGKSRLKLFANNISNEILKQRNSFLIDETRLNVLVSSFTDYFIYAFKRNADEKAMSEIVKSTIAKNHEDTKFSFLDENGNGVDPETGIKIVDREVNGTGTQT